MSFIIQSMVNGKPHRFTYKGRPSSHLNRSDLRLALVDSLANNLDLKRQKDLDIVLTMERLSGLDAQVKDVRFNKLMQILKS